MDARKLALVGAASVAVAVGTLALPFSQPAALKVHMRPTLQVSPNRYHFQKNNKPSLILKASISGAFRILV